MLESRGHKEVQNTVCWRAFTEDIRKHRIQCVGELLLRTEGGTEYSVLESCC